MRIVQKLRLHTSNLREILDNNVRLTLFYANLLQYKLLNTYLKKKTAALPAIVISLLSCYCSVRRKIEEVSYPF